MGAAFLNLRFDNALEFQINVTIEVRLKKQFKVTLDFNNTRSFAGFDLFKSGVGGYVEDVHSFLDITITTIRFLLLAAGSSEPLSCY